MNDECLLHTVVQELTPSSFPCTLNLAVLPPAGEMVDAYRLSIDAHCGDILGWHPCVRWGVYLIREINSQIHVNDATTRVKWDWLARTVRTPHQRRLEAVEGLARQKLASASVIGDRRGDAWVSANRQMRALTRTLVPKTSEGRFFLRYSEGEGVGRLELVEWLRGLLREHADKQLAWFDPYMEDVGVNLLGSQSPQSGNYVVFTNKPAAPRKRDWVDCLYSAIRKLQRRKAPEKQPDRLENLLAAARSWEQTGIGSRFRIAGMPPETLHDRMIVVTNSHSEPVIGYHLSNSIQRASENYPLLITPVPRDVLQKVVLYMQTLLAPAQPESSDGDTTVAEILYDSEVRTRNLTSPKRKGIFDYTQTPAVLAWWLEEPSLTGLSPAELRSELDRRGVLEGDSLRAPAFHQLPPQLQATGFPFADFDSAWSAMGAVLAFSTSGDAIEGAALAGLPTGFLEQLQRFLGEREQAEPVHRLRAVVPDLVSEFQRSMSELLRESSRALSAFTQSPVDVAWGDYYAIKILWRASPDRLVEWMRTTAQEKWRDDARRLFCLKCAVSEVGHTIEWGCSREQLDALFLSQVDFLRWMGFLAVEANLIGGQNSLQDIHALPGVQGHAKAQLLGWLVTRSAHNLGMV